MKIINYSGVVYAMVIGASGNKYRFGVKGVVNMTPDTGLHLFGFAYPTMYIFVTDIDNEKPTLLDIDTRDNWEITYDKINKFSFIKEHNVTHFMYRGLELDEDKDVVRCDIIDGDSFDKTEFKVVG